MRKSNNYLGALIHSREPSSELDTHLDSKGSPQGTSSVAEPVLQQTENRKAPPQAINTAAPVGMPQLPRLQSMEAPIENANGNNYLDDESDYGDALKVTPPSPSQGSDYHADVRRHSLDAPADEYSAAVLEPQSLGYDIRRLSMGVRPLPPEDPTDNPEQRANRIRSFYKEYFDDSKPGNKGDGRYEEYDEGYLGEGTYFDPVSGDFVLARAPYAEPVTRRAMTPPPRAPPRFQGQPGSSPRFLQPGPRAFSSASGRMGPRKPLPPPSPLRVLPTPHLLKEDSFALPIDFAPPSTYKDRQAGRPESPTGGMRPYSPAVRAHTPLVSSFDDLAVMPSPHLLRKSGTFTALDFAAPPRFKSSDTGSDSGSIRSNKSGMSPATLQSLRAGAYRVSRIPKDMVGTKQDIALSLKPTWELRKHDA